MKKAFSMGFAAIAIVISVVLFSQWAKDRRESEDFPEGTFWLCQAGKHEFVKTLAELAAWFSQNSCDPPCPQCGKTNTAHALRCTHRDCRRFFVAAVVLNGKAACPVCKREVRSEF